MTKYRRLQAVDVCIFPHGLCTAPCQPNADCGETSLGDNQLRYQARSVQYFSSFSLLSGMRHLEGFDSTHITVTSVSPVSVTAYSSCLGSSLETPGLLRHHVRSNPTSGSYSRDLAPKCQTLQYFTSRLLNFSNLTLSYSVI